MNGGRPHLGSTTVALKAQPGGSYLMLHAVTSVGGEGSSLSAFGFRDEGWDEPTGKNPQDPWSERDMVMNFRPHQSQLRDFG